MAQKALNPRDFGIVPDAGADLSQKLQILFDSLSAGSYVNFEKGTYLIFKPVSICGLKNITINGNGSVVIAHFDPCGPITENNNVFMVENCEDLTINGFDFETDAPIGAAGEVAAIDFEKQTVDLDIYDEFPVTGYEHICATNSFDGYGSPDYALATYNGELSLQKFTDFGGNTSERLVGLDYKVIGAQKVRLNLSGILNKENCRLKTGHRVNIRYEIYGNSIFNFVSCKNVCIKDINIYSAASFGVTIRPRCADFVFENFNIRVPENSHRLMAANADGIHILGLSGKVTLKNCNIQDLGDDTLNIHGVALGTTDIDRENRRLTLWGKRESHYRAIDAGWAQSGDTVLVYDRETFLEKATFEVENINAADRTLTYKNLKGELDDGDVLANAAFFASVHMDGCLLKNTRARGILIQTHNVLVENCHIYGMSLAAMLFSPDINKWWEIGPVRNVEIRNNTMEHCAHIDTAENQGAIVFGTCHDSAFSGYPAGVHEQIYIHGNKFKNIPNSGIFLSSAKNVRIKDNNFENCCCNVRDTSIDYAHYDIVALNCENVEICGNQSSRGDEKLTYIK